MITKEIRGDEIIVMRKLKIAAYILSIVIFIANVLLNYAHGAIYTVQDLGGDKIRISLKDNKDSKKKYEISYYYLKNGKTLNIGYQPKENLMSYIDFDLRTAIPPIRINLTNIKDPGDGNFKDIKDLETYEYIKHLHDLGIINGKSDLLFEPYANITRAEFAVIMVKALNLKLDDSYINTFKDIGNHWAKNYIIAAAKNRIITGYEDKTVRPNNPIKLAEAAAIIDRSFNLKVINKGIYGKLRQNMWYSKVLQKIFDAQVLKVSDTIYLNFDEESSINRSNAAMMISRSLDH